MRTENRRFRPGRQFKLHVEAGVGLPTATSHQWIRSTRRQVKCICKSALSPLRLSGACKAGGCAMRSCVGVLSCQPPARSFISSGEGRAAKSPGLSFSPSRHFTHPHLLHLSFEDFPTAPSLTLLQLPCNKHLGIWNAWRWTNMASSFTREQRKRV